MKMMQHCCPHSTCYFSMQFARLNQIYRERQKQLAAGVDVLKEEYRK